MTQTSRSMLLTWACLLLFTATLSSAKSVDPSSSVPNRGESEIGEFFEECGFYQSIKTTNDSPLLKVRSKYQDIEIHNSKHYGKILVLDGVLQLTERDASAYNEMLAHIPLFQHSKPKRVLVLGGGDGYVLSEVLKHESVEHVDHVDLDGDVIETCRRHFPWGEAWEDPRVSLHIADGAAFARDTPDGTYDVIIQDSSDPWTTSEDGEQVTLPSSVLYSEEHFRNLHRILKPDGVLNLQAETFTLPSDLKGIVKWRHQALDIGFVSAKYGSLYISSYPTGQIGFLTCEKSPTSATMKIHIKQRFQRMQETGTKTAYYHPRLQESSFDLPLWVHERIYGSTDALSSVCPERNERRNEDIA